MTIKIKVVLLLVDGVYVVAKTKNLRTKFQMERRVKLWSKGVKKVQPGREKMYGKGCKASQPTVESWFFFEYSVAFFTVPWWCRNCIYTLYLIKIVSKMLFNTWFCTLELSAQSYMLWLYVPRFFFHFFCTNLCCTRFARWRFLSTSNNCYSCEKCSRWWKEKSIILTNEYVVYSWKHKKNLASNTQKYNIDWIFFSWKIHIT